MSKFTPLTRRSENVQKDKFKKKVKNILQASEDGESVTSETIQEYGVTSSYLQEYFIPESPCYNISLAAMQTAVEQFYVNDLVPISTLQCGCLLKNWSEIPGRDVSPQRSISVSNNADDTEESSEIHNFSDTAEGKQEQIVASPKYDVDEILEPNSTIETSSDKAECSSVDHMTKSSNCQGNGNVFQALRSPASNDAGQKSDERHLADLTHSALNARLLSPDMFADYESSANNSLNDGKILETFTTE